MIIIIVFMQYFPVKNGKKNIKIKKTYFGYIYTFYLYFGYSITLF